MFGVWSQPGSGGYWCQRSAPTRPLRKTNLVNKDENKLAKLWVYENSTESDEKIGLKRMSPMWNMKVQEKFLLTETFKVKKLNEIVFT